MMCPRAGEGAILRCLGIGVGAHYVGGGLGAGALAASAAIMQEQCTGRREQERWPTGRAHACQKHWWLCLACLVSKRF